MMPARLASCFVGFVVGDALRIDLRSMESEKEWEFGVRTLLFSLLPVLCLVKAHSGSW
jgi:hypothetical protein